MSQSTFSTVTSTSRDAGRYCALLSLGLAAADGGGHLLTANTAHALSMFQFLERYSATCALYLILSLTLWAFAWVFMVRIGGVRPGIGLLFIGIFLLGFNLSVDVADARYRELVSELWSFRPIMIAGLGAASLFVSAAISLLVGRLFRHVEPQPAIMRGGAFLVLFLIGADVALWLKSTILPGTALFTYWVIAALAALAMAYGFLRLSRNPSRVRFATWLVLIGALLPFPWAVAQPGAQHAAGNFVLKSHPTKHVILITIDALRHDAVTTCDPDSGVTTQVDRIARDGTALLNAFSSAPWTLPAMASLMTGLPPRVHQAVDFTSSLPKQARTLAEYMSKAGYRTAGMGDNFFLNPRTNMDRGFHEYHWYPTPLLKAKAFDVGLIHWLLTAPFRTASAEELTDLAIEWFRTNARDDSFFWIHYYEPHMPYAPPKEFLKQNSASAAKSPRFWNLAGVRNGHVGRTREDRIWLRSLYDAEVRYVDHQVGRLLNTLQALGLYDDALIILTSDHGEEFWDHGGFEHGHSLFNELIRVPLFIKRPGEHRNEKSESYVSTRALMPTVLDICGIAQPADGIVPRPFTALLDDPQGKHDEEPIISGALLYFDQAESVIFDHMKFVRSEVSGREMLFDLTQDAKEAHSIVKQDPANAARGRRLLDAAAERATAVKQKLGVDQGKDDVPLDDQDRQILQTLGYL